MLKVLTDKDSDISNLFVTFVAASVLLPPAAPSPRERPNHSTTSKVAYFKRKYAEEEDLQERLHGYFRKVGACVHVFPCPTCFCASRP